MWHNNKSVIAVYAHTNAQLAYAIIQDLSGWIRIKPTSADGVTNVLDIITSAKVNGKNVHVYVTGNQIVSAYVA